MSQAELRAALADDVDGLAQLHDRELSAAQLADLEAVGFPDNFALLPGDEVRDAMRHAFHAVALAEDRSVSVAAVRDVGEAAAMGRAPTSAEGAADPGAASRLLDALAADFAGIYLNGACGASPYESVWVTDEHLTCQLPMFELRTLYQQAGLAVDDWRKRYDDHLVLQLQYLAHRLRDPKVALEEIGRFLDEHLAYWFPDFARTVAQRADTDFYRALAVLTADWLDKLRGVIEEVTGETRTAREVIAERTKKKMALASGELSPVKFIPGGRPAAGPSW